MKFVNILDANKAAMLEDMGFRAKHETVTVNGKETTVYVFAESDKLHKLLKDRTQFSKKDYYYTNTLKL